MFTRGVWVKGLGVLAVATILAVGGMVAGSARAPTASAQMWYFNPVTGFFTAEPIVSTTPVFTTSSYVSPVYVSYAARTPIYVAPAVSYSDTPVVTVPSSWSWVSPGGSYCMLGNDLIWIPFGASP